VTFPGALPLPMRNVCSVGAIGGERSGVNDGERILPGEDAVNVDGEELGIESVRTGTGGEEENALAVGCPSHDLVGAGMVGEPLGHASCGRDDEDVRIAVVFAGERDPTPIG